MFLLHVYTCFGSESILICGQPNLSSAENEFYYNFTKILYKIIDLIQVMKMKKASLDFENTRTVN